MEMSSAILEFLREERRTEINEGTKNTHFCIFLSRTHPNSHTVNVYCCCLVVQIGRVTVMLSVLVYSTFTVQRDRVTVMLSVLVYSTFTVQRDRVTVMLSVLGYSTFIVQRD
jgi:hypothetical protein